MERRRNEQNRVLKGMTEEEKERGNTENCKLGERSKGEKTSSNKYQPAELYEKKGEAKRETEKKLASGTTTKNQLPTGQQSRNLSLNQRIFSAGIMPASYHFTLVATWRKTIGPGIFLFY